MKAAAAHVHVHTAPDCAGPAFLAERVGIAYPDYPVLRLDHDVCAQKIAQLMIDESYGFYYRKAVLHWYSIHEQTTIDRITILTSE